MEILALVGQLPDVRSWILPQMKMWTPQVAVDITVALLYSPGCLGGSSCSSSNEYNKRALYLYLGSFWLELQSVLYLARAPWQLDIVQTV